MALTVTLAEMARGARQRTERVGSRFVDDATEVYPWINEGIREFWRIITDVDPDRGLVTAALTTTAGTREYSLPSRFMRMRGLDFPLGGGRYRECLSYKFQERNSLGFVSGGPPRYRVIRGGVNGSAARLSLLPDPGSRTYLVHYVEAPAVLTLAGDTFDGVAGFERFPMAWAAIKIRGKAQESADLELLELNEVKASIIEEAGRRDVSGTAKIARTRKQRRHRRNFPVPWRF